MYLIIKRVSDFLFSVIGLVILSPLFIILIFAIRLESKGPVLFRQKRIGKNKTTFMILKFRTMHIDAPRNTPTHQLLDPNKWITKVGSFLRKTSLDELPQMINIFRGEMSFVGPRPALWNQYDLIHERDKYNANDIKPGLTGLAQISGRDDLSIETKAKYDGIYFSNIGLGMDTKCFLKTIISVFRKEGIVEGAIRDLDDY